MGPRSSHIRMTSRYAVQAALITCHRDSNETECLPRPLRARPPLHADLAFLPFPLLFGRTTVSVPHSDQGPDVASQRTGQGDKHPFILDAFPRSLKLVAGFPYRSGLVMVSEAVFNH